MKAVCPHLSCSKRATVPSASLTPAHSSYLDFLTRGEGREGAVPLTTTKVGIDSSHKNTVTSFNSTILYQFYMPIPVQFVKILYKLVAFVTTS
jgi:hypothetical protein